jgi:hypothetical protein
MVDKRQGAAGGRRRRRQRREPRQPIEPILIAARRPGAPPTRRADHESRRSAPLLAYAQPKPAQEAPPPVPVAPAPSEPAQRRSARIVQRSNGPNDEAERQRLRLLDRLIASDGRGAITRAAREYRQAGHEFPVEQRVQLQLLQHFDEELAHRAIVELARLLELEPPLKRPVLEQRLRRLEEYAEDAQIREAAAALRRALRAKGDAPVTGIPT